MQLNISGSAMNNLANTHMLEINVVIMRVAKKGKQRYTRLVRDVVYSQS